MSEQYGKAFDATGSAVQPGDPLSYLYAQLSRELPPTAGDAQLAAYSNGTTYDRCGQPVHKQSLVQLIAETARKGWHGPGYNRKDVPDGP